MIRVSDIKGFISQDCLGDWLRKYHPLPSLPSPYKIVDKQTLQASLLACFDPPLKSTVGCTPSAFDEHEILLDVACKDNSKWQGCIDCLIHPDVLASNRYNTSKLKSTIPFSLLSMWKVGILLFAPQAPTSTQQEWLRTKRYLYKHMLSTAYTMSAIGCMIISWDSTSKSFILKELQSTHSDSWVESIVNQGYDWYHSLHQEQRFIGINLDQCMYAPSLKLMPNTSIQDQYSAIRDELAWRWKDVGLLYWVGPSNRSKLHKLNVFTLDHPLIPEALLRIHKVDQLQDSKIMQYQMTMLARMFLPIQSINVEWSNTQEYQKYAYFDIETTKDQDNQDVCHIAGIFYYNPSINSYDFKYFESKDNTSAEQSIKFIQECLPTHTIVHYTPHDKSAIPTSSNTLDLIEVLKDNYLTDENLQRLHLNNFKLKAIYKNMCKRCNFINLYDEYCSIKNGLQAMYKLEEWKQSSSTSDDHEILEVIKYNKVDCIALALVHMYINNSWDEQLDSYLKIQYQTTTPTPSST